MKHNKWLGPIVLTIIILVAGVYLYSKIYTNWLEQPITVHQPVINKVIRNNSPQLKEIIHEAEKHVVQIESKNEGTTITGSGFLYNDQGDIITNAHVIANADMIYVRTANAHIYPAAVIGIGEDTDIAVIRVPQLERSAFLEVEMEHYSDIGDEVIALGSPHGFQNTVTLGIISGTERNFSVDGFDYQNVYQISAQITHGNSGGPLINRETGKVIGINSVGTEDGTIGFSIPIQEVIEQIQQWSNEANNEELNIASMSEILSDYDVVQMKDDATYLIDYFFEGLQIRDYLIAYTLLGSDLKSSLSYADFRDLYTHMVELEYHIQSQEMIENNIVKSHIQVIVENKFKDEEKTETETLEYIFNIGVENDQLKIINIQQSSYDES